MSYLPGMDFLMSHEADVFGLWIVPDVLERLSVIHPCVVDGILEGIVEDGRRSNFIVSSFSFDFVKEIGFICDCFAVDFVSDFESGINGWIELVHLSLLVHLPMDSS